VIFKSLTPKEITYHGVVQLEGEEKGGEKKQRNKETKKT
jgi:hypothetical protein